MERIDQHNLRQIVKVWIWGLAAVLILFICGAEGIAAETDFLVRVRIDSIDYRGEDIYEIKTAVTNIVDEAIVLIAFQQQFLIQNNGLGKWTELAVANNSEKDGDEMFLLPGKQQEHTAQLALSSSMPDLYKNNDDEVNIRMKSQVILKRQKDGQSLINEEESSYWLKLHTSDWILREGM